MSDSVIICIKILLDVGYRFYLEIYLIQVFFQGQIVRVVFASCPSESSGLGRIARTVRTCGQDRCLLRFVVLRMYNIQMKVLEGCLGLLRGLISAKYLIQGRRFERNTNVKGLKPPVIITTWKWLITCPLIDLI